MIILFILIVLAIIIAMFIIRSTTWSDKRFRLLKKLCSDAIPSEYNKGHFAKSKFGYTLKFKNTEKDYLVLTSYLGRSDFSIVTKEFGSEQFMLDERIAVLSEKEDMGFSKISIQLRDGSGIFEITHVCIQVAPMSKDQFIKLLKKINLVELEKVTFHRKNASKFYNSIHASRS